ncbi:hypothetical protein ACS0TY_005988 [Phlomoides rotata]
MKKQINSINLHFLLIALPALLLLLLCAVTTAEEEERCNATRIGDCLGEDEEFLTESETTRRLLTSRRGVIDVSGSREAPFCNRNRYGNCVPNPRPSDRGPRRCNYHTCSRAPR